ncbi:MAG: hypothetical protein KAS32_01410 [Candidatus Peribacteraceae bacterium]|nr:hypothetical protein [Candidatus Peribacteraceae bacterium]
MPLFYYSGNDVKGRFVQGTVDAISTQDARDSLKGMNIETEELHGATIEEKNIASGGSFNNFDSARKDHIVFDVVKESNEVKSAPFGLELMAERKCKMQSSNEEKSKTKKQTKERKNISQKVKKQYYPLIDTLRLYAGWLLAWYVLVYAIGAYQHTRKLPFSIPYVEALLPPYSSIVFACTLSAFLFLLLSSIYKALRGGIARGISLSLFGVAVFFLYRINL